MEDDINFHLEEAKESMNESMDRLQRELSKIRAGKASPAMLSGIQVDYYGSATPISQVANISTSDPKTLSIQPWEKAMIGPIEQAIFAANIGLTPMNNGESIIINIPALTEERRKDMVKRSKAMGEDAKVSIRTARHKALDYIKKAVKLGYPEDEGKRREDDVQKIINSYTEKINSAIAAKEKDIMTI